MASNIFRLKEAVLKEIPVGELPWQVFIRLTVKTRFPWASIREDTEVSQEQFDTALLAIEEIFGKKIQ